MALKLQCFQNDHCPFQYQCLDNICKHQSMFPLKTYPIFVYLLIPFFITFCNIGGLSAGILKILILMVMLNYPAGQATHLAYAIITGGALANLLMLIPQKHPVLKTPLINYDIVFILLPGILFGSTIGVILNKLLIDIVQDIIVIVVLIYFSYACSKKYFQKKKIMNSMRKGSSSSWNSAGLLEDYQQQDELSKTEQRKKFDKRQQGYNLKNVFVTAIIFALIQLMTVFAQGKIVPFNICSNIFNISIALYTFFIIIGIIGAYKFILLRMRYYKAINYKYVQKLDNKRIFLKIVFTGLIAGFLQGLIGIGSGHTINLSLLSFDILPRICSATSGFIIFFIGSASLIQAFLLDELVWDQALLLFSVTFVGSFILTYLMRKYLKKNSSIDLVILLVLALICIFSIAGVVANIIMSSIYFGFDILTVRKNFC